MPRAALPTFAAVCVLLGAPACREASETPSGREPTSGAGGSLPSGSGAASATSSAGASGAGAAAGVRQGGATTGGTTTAGGDGGAAGGETANVASLLVFSRTVEYRHDSIPVGVQALEQLAADRGWRLEATEDPSRFTDEGLAAYDAVIFLSTTGDVLDEAEQRAFERFIRSGKGFVGIHSASDTEYDWPWYGALVGAYFREHPAVQAADVLVETPANPATVGLPIPWRRTDEWYAFQSNPRANVQVLLSLHEDSYDPGSASMNGDHPIAWSHEHDGGRAFYTALGHTPQSYSEPLFIQHVAGGIAWVLR